MTPTIDIQTLEQWVGEDTRSIAFALLALRYLEQGNGEKALQVVQNGLEKYPHYPFGHFVAGLCYYNKKDLAEAKNHLDLSVTYDPVNPRAWQLLAEINRQLELNLVAEDCELRLAGIDGFSPAVASVAVGAVTTPSEDSEESIPDLLEDIPDLETAENVTSEDELNLEELFEEETSGESKDTLDVDEIFKEAVGDLEEAVEESAPPEAPAEETTESPAEEKQEADEFSSAMDNFFSDLEEKDNAPEAPPAEDAATAETEPTAETSEPEPGSEAVTDDLFDFSQAVEEFLSEREEESRQEETAEPAATETTSESAPGGEEESEFIIDLDDTEIDSSSEGEEVSKPPIISSTLGEIYISQGRFQEAIQVFEQLLQQDPDNPHFKRKIREIQNLIDKQKKLDA